MSQEANPNPYPGDAEPPPLAEASPAKEKKEKKKKDKDQGKDADGDAAGGGEDEGGGKKKSKKRLAREAAQAEEARIKAEAEAEAEAIRLAEIEANRPKTPEPDPTIHLVLKPVDSGWLMGEPLHVEVLLDSNIFGLRALLEEKKKISPHRMFIRDVNNKTLSVVQEKNSFRRLALNDGAVFVIEPTTPGCWLWHKPSWYVDKFIKDITAVIDKAPQKQATLEELNREVIVPLHFRDKSIIVFCRKYPEHFHVHVDVNKSQYWVRKPTCSNQLGTTTDGPGEIGKIVHYKPSNFNWEAYADINDTKRVELNFTIPDMVYEITIMSAKDIMRADTFGSSDPFCVVYFFNGIEYKKLGQTNARRNTLNPVWVDQRFTLSINASLEVEVARLLVEMWDSDIGSHGQNIQGDFLGAVELTGMPLETLIADGETHVMEYPLQQREESSPNEDQSGVKGTLFIKGGKAGYEVSLVNCRGLVELPNKYSKPFGVILFNNEEIDTTLPEQRNVRDPIYTQTVNIYFSEMSRKLVDCTLEFQMWATVGAGPGVDDEDARGDFMGSLQFVGEDLVTFLRGNLPYATMQRRMLKQSVNIPLKQRKKTTEGYMTVIGGPAGLPMAPGKKVEIIIEWVEKIAKVFKCYAEVEWNYIQVGTTDLATVAVGGAEFYSAFQLETTAGSADCLHSHLRLDLFEDPATAVGAQGATYMGMIEISGEELSELCDGTFAERKEFEWQLDPNKEGRLQRLVRGKAHLRGGLPKARLIQERVLVVSACRFLGLANRGAMLGLGSSDPYVEVTFNGNRIGVTPVEQENLNPVWESQYFFFNIPPLRVMLDAELKAWVSRNEQRKAEGLPAIERTLYHESVLMIAVYDQKDDGSEGICLGCVVFEEGDLVKFFDSKEAISDWYPLGKNTIPVDKKNPNLFNPKTAKPTLGDGAAIKIGTPAKQYSSPVQWELAVEAAIEAENERLREIEEERLAIEAQELEREYQAQLKAEQAELAEEAARIAAEEAEKKAKELMDDDAASAALSAAEQSAADEAAAIETEKAAKKKAEQEAYEDLMMLEED